MVLPPTGEEATQPASHGARVSSPGLGENSKTGKADLTRGEKAWYDRGGNVLGVRKQRSTELTRSLMRDCRTSEFSRNCFGHSHV